MQGWSSPSQKETTVNKNKTLTKSKNKKILWNGKMMKLAKKYSEVNKMEIDEGDSLNQIVFIKYKGNY